MVSEKISLNFRSPEDLAGVLGGITILPYTSKSVSLAAPVMSVVPSGMGGFGTYVSTSLRPSGVNNIVALGDGALLIQGEASAVAELKTLIRQLDVAVPSISCRVEVVSVAGGGKNQNRNVLLAPFATGKCGTEIKASSKFSGTPAQTSKIDVVIKAIPMSDNYFDVETRWEASIPLPGAQKGQLIRLEKIFSTTRRVKAGETVVFGGVILKEEQGATKEGNEVLFFLTIAPL
jgi:hypothetical protein